MGEKIPYFLGNEIRLIGSTVPQKMCLGCLYCATQRAGCLMRLRNPRRSCNKARARRPIGKWNLVFIGCLQLTNRNPSFFKASWGYHSWQLPNPWEQTIAYHFRVVFVPFEFSQKHPIFQIGSNNITTYYQETRNESNP